MAQKITVGVCTSGSKVKLAAFAGGKFNALSKRSLNQEKILFPMLDRLLAAHKAGLEDISTLCVVSGPGRFTGLRVGLTLAGVLKTLAGIRVYSSTLFEILAVQAAVSKEFRAWAACREEPRVAALTHAFKDEYFCQVFQVSVAAGQRGGGTARRQDRGIGRAASNESWSTSRYLKPVEAPRWLKDIEMTGYLDSLGCGLYVIADAEEKEDIYSLLPAGHEKAPMRISKILPDFIIKTGLALKNRNLSPLYLKPAKYEQNNQSHAARHRSQAGGLRGKR
jgi:tRNA threonylcarbamoyl adenosine modification protein YeaZ